MILDREYLKATLDNLRSQEREILDSALRARGAVMLAEAMLADLDKPAPETDSTSGGPSAPATLGGR